jgi:gamma-glutamylcyclotransferase (GGCT)/AIG2-like uncharacterized protein YtfP
MSEDTVKFFVYGTLRVGGHFAKQFDKARISSTPAKLKGQLFNVSGWFPGIVLGGDEDVYGEVHEYSDGKRVKSIFDSIEGYSEGRESNMYNRMEVEVVTAEGDTIKAFAYEFGKPEQLLESGNKIENGKWEVKGVSEIESF